MEKEFANLRGHQSIPKPVVLVRFRMSGGDKYTESDQAMVEGLMEMANDYGWRLFNLELSQGTIPKDVNPVGAILRALPTDPLPQQLTAMGLPVVRIGNFPHPQDDQMPAVLFDYEAAARLAAEYFVQRGFQHLGFIGRDPWANAESFYMAFERRARQLNCACHLLRLKQKTLADPSIRDEERARAVGKWLTGIPDRPLGLVAFSDAVGAIQCNWCQSRGFHVPGDVAILGRGNRLFDCESAPVPLSSIDINRKEKGRVAARLLHDLILGAPAPKTPLLIPPKGVITRQSTDRLAVHDPIVIHALTFLDSHLTESVSVNDVAAATGVSRRKLERAFREALNSSVNVELRRKRLELASELLLSTDLTIAAVAESTGIGSSVYFHRVFNAAYGMTPHQYRLHNED